MVFKVPCKLSSDNIRKGNKNDLKKKKKKVLTIFSIKMCPQEGDKQSSPTISSRYRREWVNDIIHMWFSIFFVLNCLSELNSMALSLFASHLKRDKNRMNV